MCHAMERGISMAKGARWAMRIYVVLCFVILLSCIIMLAMDLNHYVKNGEFITFQEFNMTKYKITPYPYENFAAAARAYERLILSDDYRKDSLPHLLLSFSLWAGQLNFVAFYIHKWRKIKMRKWSKYVIWVEFVLTVALIVAIRLAMGNCWGGDSEAKFLYPAAYWLF